MPAPPGGARPRAARPDPSRRRAWRRAKVARISSSVDAGSPVRATSKSPRSVRAAGPRAQAGSTAKTRCPASAQAPGRVREAPPSAGEQDDLAAVLDRGRPAPSRRPRAPCRARPSPRAARPWRAAASAGPGARRAPPRAARARRLSGLPDAGVVDPEELLPGLDPLAFEQGRLAVVRLRRRLEAREKLRVGRPQGRFDGFGGREARLGVCQVQLERDPVGAQDVGLRGELVRAREVGRERVVEEPEHLRGDRGGGGRVSTSAPSASRSDSARRFCADAAAARIGCNRPRPAWASSIRAASDSAESPPMRQRRARTVPSVRAAPRPSGRRRVATGGTDARDREDDRVQAHRRRRGRSRRSATPCRRARAGPRAPRSRSACRSRRRIARGQREVVVVAPRDSSRRARRAATPPVRSRKRSRPAAASRSHASGSTPRDQGRSATPAIGASRLDAHAEEHVLGPHAFGGEEKGRVGRERDRSRPATPSDSSSAREASSRTEMRAAARATAAHDPRAPSAPSSGPNPRPCSATGFPARAARIAGPA